MDFRKYFENRDLTKIPGEGLHFEQKTTPDLIWCVSLAISELIQADPSRILSDSDIRESRAFNSLMQDYFSKAPQAKATNEYNKVSSYQLGLLAFAGVLEIVAQRPKRYRVANQEAIAFLSMNDLNASRFVTEYTEKFLRDNSLINVFKQYRDNPNQDNHLRAKEAYWEWAKINTRVRSNNRSHTYRVFNKIFNIYCYKNRVPGEDAANITQGPCPYSFLIYNRTNFRDKDMPVGMTRQQYKAEILSEIENEGYVGTILKKAKDAVRTRYGNDSEIKDPALGYAPNRVVEAHHILPQHSYAEFSLSRENLIVLTPDQHRSLAHDGNYRTINLDFQRVCLRQKFENIRASIEAGEDFYNLENFIKILNACFGSDIAQNSPLQSVAYFVATI